MSPFWIHFSILFENILGFSIVNTLNVVKKCKIYFLENSRKNVRYPYSKEDGGGQERYKNFLIFFPYEGEEVQLNKDMFKIYALF